MIPWVRTGSVVLVSVGVLTIGDVHAQRSDGKTRRIYLDQVIPDAPRTLGGRLRQVDAAIRCRIEHSDVRVVHNEVPPGIDPSVGVEPATEHVVTVLEVFKAHPQVPAVGLTTTIRQPVGTVVVDGITIIKTDGTVRVFQSGDEYVLFVRWNAAEDAFEVQNAGDVFQLTGGGVAASPWPYARDVQGIPIAEFLARMRTAAIP